LAHHRERNHRGDETPNRAVNLDRLETLADAVFAFALTLLAFDLRLPAVAPEDLAQGLLALLPKLLIFIFAFLVIAQEWDVHHRTMLHIAHGDGTLVWLCLLSLMFVVLMPASADILGRYPLQPLSLVVFGTNLALLCLASWVMWRYASHTGRLLDVEISPAVVRMISRLWLYPSIIFLVSIPLGFVSVYPVYVIWVLMPVLSYSYSTWVVRRGKEKRAAKRE
jgi:uncharacterized membrane protein